MSGATAPPTLDGSSLGLAVGLALALLRSGRDEALADRTGADAGTADAGRSIGSRRSYPQMVEALRELVAAHVPDVAEVLVISRGDPALVDLGSRTGRHFPADATGAWAGHHPALGAAAAMLAEQRGAAGHLVVPATSSWWFDTYPELVALLSEGRCLAEVPDVGSVWELPRRVDHSAPVPVVDHLEVGAYRSATAHAASLVASLVPEGETVLVISRGDPERIELSPAVGRHFPCSPDGTYAGHPADDRHALALLSRSRSEGATWLLVPADVNWWADAYSGFWQRLHDEHRTVIDRPDVGRLIRLTPTTDQESR